ncbi:MAG: ATP-binding protein [Thermomicrobiales bacterium]
MRCATSSPTGSGSSALAPIGDRALVLPTIARVLQVRETKEQPLLDRVRAFLRPRHALLVLDNVEHVVAGATVATDLLTSCPELRILATSRVRLRLSGEHNLPIPPLALPDPAASPEVEELERSAAVALFVARARAVRPDFALTTANARAVAEICRRLDGLPLAIELAAARIGHLPPAALLSLLERCLPILTGGPRDLPARLQTMRNAIAWSYDLLSPDEQILFRHLAVFTGGFSLETAELVGGEAARRRGGERTDDSFLPPSRLPASPPSVLDLLASLVDKSLVQQVEGTCSDARYRMLETIREYGWERLADCGEEDATRRRHAAQFLALAERAEPGLTGPEQADWLDPRRPRLPAKQ